MSLKTFGFPQGVQFDTLHWKDLLFALREGHIVRMVIPVPTAKANTVYRRVWNHLPVLPERPRIIADKSQWSSSEAIVLLLIPRHVFEPLFEPTIR